MRRGMWRVTFCKAVRRSNKVFEPGPEYEMSGAHFWHFWCNAHHAINCYQKLDPELGLYDRTESGPCVVVACGPSLKDFPFEKLRGWDVLACNRAHEMVPWAKYMVTMDYGAFLENPGMHKALQEYKRTIFTKTGGGRIHPKAVEFPWPTRSSMVSDSIAEGMHARHSGQAAVNVAYCLGYNPIYFLGVDCQVIRERPHFYEEESEALRKYILRPVDGYDATRMAKWRGSMDGQAKQYAFRGVDVVNLGPDSSLQEYVKRDWQEVLR